MLSASIEAAALPYPQAPSMASNTIRSAAGDQEVANRNIGNGNDEAQSDVRAVDFSTLGAWNKRRGFAPASFIVRWVQLIQLVRRQILKVFEQAAHGVSEDKINR